MNIQSLALGLLAGSAGKSGLAGGNLQNIFNGMASGTNASSGLGNSGSGKIMNRKEFASQIRKSIGAHPEMSNKMRGAMARFANKIDGTNASSGSSPYGLGNNSSNQNNSMANDLRKAADSLDGGNTAQNDSGYGLNNGSQDPLQKLMDMLSGKNMPPADKKALGDLMKQLTSMMDGQGGGNALQESGNQSNDQMSTQELGQALKDFGDDLMNGDQNGSNLGLSNDNANSMSITIKM